MKHTHIQVFIKECMKLINGVCLKADTLFFFCCLVCSDIHKQNICILTRALSSAYIVLCGVWCLDQETQETDVLSFGSCRASDTALHFLSLCECAVSGSLETAHSCPRVFCCVARSSCFYRLRAFMLYLVLCGTSLYIH